MTLRNKLIIIGNTIIALLTIYFSMILVVAVNSQIVAVVLALIIAAWLWLVFGKHNIEYSAAE